MRFIGLDVHRTFAEVAVVTNGQVHPAGRILPTATGLEAFAKTLTREDHVVLEATGNTDAIARVLAQLLAADFLPAVWMPDETTYALRRQVARRAQLLRQRTRLKNQMHAVLHRNLIPPCPATDLFGQRGRAGLRCQEFPVDEGTAVAAYLRALDCAGEELVHLDEALARAVGERPEIRRLLTVPGIDMAVAAWAASRTPGPRRAFFRRICTKRGPQVAAVATARKLVILVWHMLTKEQDYLGGGPPSPRTNYAGWSCGRARQHAEGGGVDPHMPTTFPSFASANARDCPRRARLPTTRCSLAPARPPRDGRRCHHRGASLTRAEAHPARWGFHPHAPLFGSGVTCAHAPFTPRGPPPSRGS